MITGTLIENLMETVQKVEKQQVMRCFGCGAKMECNWCPAGECECRKDEQVMCGSCMWIRGE